MSKFVTISGYRWILMRPAHEGDVDGHVQVGKAGGELRTHSSREAASQFMDAFWATRGWPAAPGR